MPCPPPHIDDPANDTFAGADDGKAGRLAGNAEIIGLVSTHMVLNAPEGRLFIDRGNEGEIAVTLRAASANETSRLLCRAYALTQREREVVAAIVDGLDTRAVSTRLFISQHTVQDHLKAVFDKTGVRSRRVLLARAVG